MALTVVCLLPQMLFAIFYPHPFDITAHRESVDYEFADKDLAAEFAACNLDAEWLKVNDFTIKRREIT